MTKNIVVKVRNYDLKGKLYFKKMTDNGISLSILTKYNLPFQANSLFNLTSPLHKQYYFSVDLLSFNYLEDAISTFYQI